MSVVDTLKHNIETSFSNPLFRKTTYNVSIKNTPFFLSWTVFLIETWGYRNLYIKTASMSPLSSFYTQVSPYHTL